MRPALLIPLAVGAALALTATSPAPKKPVVRTAPPSARDWSQVATRLPSGTFLQGNPRAKVKLVEYLSLTCPHCAHMAKVAVPSLTREYIRTGRVSYEVRPASRDPLDLVAFTYSRCKGPRGFFAVLPALYATQDDWVGKGYAYLQATPPAEGKSSSEMIATLAKISGLDTFFAGKGLPIAQQAACGAGRDPALLSQMAAKIWTPAFAGTPNFQINGRDAGTLGSWDDLNAKLVAAGA